MSEDKNKDGKQPATPNKIVSMVGRIKDTALTESAPEMKHWVITLAASDGSPGEQVQTYGYLGLVNGVLSIFEGSHDIKFMADFDTISYVVCGKSG